jgi:2'-5' RNA ligase
MRLFFALWPAEGLRHELARRARALEGRLRPVTADNVHLTLRFLGETEPERIPALLEGARRTMVGPPLDLWVQGGGAFPPRRPRVLWAGVHGQTEVLVERALALEREVVALGWEPERYPYTPHVTVARVKGRVPRRTVEALAQWPRLGALDSTRIGLFRSELSSEGARYSVIEWIR